jgi:protein-disulfide isomerase
MTRGVSHILRPLILAVVLVTGLGLAADAQAQAVAPITADDFTLGNPKAKVTVIEYASASCPHCARFNNEVFPAFRAKYIDTGKIHYAYRPFLTQPAAVAAAGALVARCAGKAKAFAVIDAYFQGQQHMYDTDDLRGGVLAAGKAGGLDATQVDACLADDAAIRALNARVKTYVEQDKIDSTPTFVVNGKRLVGDQTLAELDTAIAKAQAAGPAHHRRH